MSLLTLMQRECDLLSLVRPAVVIGSTDQAIRTLYALALEEADDLASSFYWQALTRQHTFVTTATPEQTGAIPDDLDRFTPNSFFNRSQQRPIIGPITPQQWQAIQAYPAYASVFLAFRERDNTFLMTPTPPASQTIAYEYISKNWARNAALDASYTEWQVDTDTSYTSERLIRLGLRWRWRKSKGLPYAEDYETYMEQRDQEASRDGASGAISITGWTYNILGMPNVPEGNWPG